MADIFEYRKGDGPILISFPHDGTGFPVHIKHRLNRHGMENADCDWHIYELYKNILDKNTSFIRPAFSRYVVDLNRSPDGELLYPGRLETGICPLTTFNGLPIYLPGEKPDESEIRSRTRTYWQPCHDHIQAELNRIRDRHGCAILWDAHSIRGEIPELFDGVLPDLNFGTAAGRSCGEAVIGPLVEYAGGVPGYSVVLNGRFKGGYVTRRYGDPENGIHAIQLEINQNNYLEDSENPSIDHKKTQRLSRLLRSLLQSLT